MSTNGYAEEYAKEVGRRISSIMYERGVSQAQMANDLKISRGTLSNWMNGKRLPRAAAMDSICRYLRCTRADILDAPATPVRAVPEPAGDADSQAADLIGAALEAAGCGHLRGLFRAAVGADAKSIEFVTEILRRNQEKK